MCAEQPASELHRIADGRRKQHRLHMAWQQTQTELPNDAPFAIVEAVKLIHHDSPHVVEVKGFFVQQSVQQNLRDDDQNLRARIHFPVSSHQANFIRIETPLDNFLLNLAKLLIGQRDQRRRVVNLLTELECFVECGFGDQRFSGSSRRTDEHTLLLGEPRK